MSFMKKFSNALVNITKDVPADESMTAGVAIGTSINACLTDPLYAGLTNIAAICLFKRLRTPGNIAAVGASTALSLAFGPIGGLLCTTAYVACNRMVEATLGATPDPEIIEVKFARPQQSAYVSH